MGGQVAIICVFGGVNSSPFHETHGSLGKQLGFVYQGASALAKDLYAERALYEPVPPVGYSVLVGSSASRPVLAA